MRKLSLFVLTLAIAACSSSTATQPTRYNFAVVAGQNQQSTASDAAPEQSVKSMLTSDPNGTFASRVLDRVGDFLAPAVAYAQGLTLTGTPVANTLVCGREAKPGEPTVVPLCVYTLPDGTAPSAIKAGTKAGTYTMPYSAQVPGQSPLPDSTPFTVLPGAPVQIGVGNFGGDSILVGATYDLHKAITVVVDKYSNAIYTMGDTTSNYSPSYAVRGAVSDVPAAPDAAGWIVTPGLKAPGKVFVFLFAGGTIVAGPLGLKVQ
jgi:hypothetical protein